MSSEDFGLLRKTSDFFGRLWPFSGIFGNDCVVFKNPSTPRIKISRLYLGKSWQVYLYMWHVFVFVCIFHMVKNCHRGLENAARGCRQRAAFSRRRSQFFRPTLSWQITCLFFPCSKLGDRLQMGLFAQLCHWIGLRAVYQKICKKIVGTSE